MIHPVALKNGIRFIPAEVRRAPERRAIRLHGSIAPPLTLKAEAASGDIPARNDVQLQDWRTLCCPISFVLLSGTLAIGANSAIYSVAKAVIFAPLPFPKPDRLVHIFESNVGERFQPGVGNLITVRPGTYQAWREQSRSFESMAAVQNTQATIMEGDRASVADGFLVDDAADGSPIVVLADRIWRERYNADPSILGREIVLNGAAHRVVGVMPPSFLPTAYGSDPQFWLPLRWDAATKYSWVLWGNWVYPRLKDGVTLGQAQSEDSEPLAGPASLSGQRSTLDVCRGCQLVVHSDAARVLGPAPESAGC